jgi:uncharacterized YigZ family protein
MEKIAREFLTIVGNAESRAVIKGSQFISYCARVATAEEALNFLQSLRARHYDATHNCWAYRISPQEYRFNDDGEPGGSAGQPILQAIIGMHLEQVAVNVTRYFGGVKLGVGGLARAYGGGAAAVLKAAGSMLVKPKVTLTIAVAFAEQNLLYRFLETHKDIAINNTEYCANGLKLAITLFQSERERLLNELRDNLRGRIEIEEQ